MDDTSSKFRRIGAGFCGTVWTAAEGGSAYKREDGGPDRSLRNDSNMHQRLSDCMRDTIVQIPIHHDFITPNDDWWGRNLSRFPEGYKPCNMIHAQRIPAVRGEIRQLLTIRFCPPGLANEILESDTNRDCLIRPYLGRRRISRPSRFRAFSLRNYPLHIDQMEELGIPEDDIRDYARAMAEALAVMHWVGEVDGNDIEFVLATPNNGTGMRKDMEGRIWHNALGEHQMWLLDFDLVRDMTMDEQGVRQAVTAFLKNDPFCPRPDQHSELWATFRQQYLVISEKCLSNSKVLHRDHVSQTQSLPELFIHLLESQT
ncbi:zinc finger protein [Aspergillus mulundensis]|uniref:DUF3669 domain-containing protein n=1 Tax=Aspergillus mulundensis TaxID=1810919 RepID=A0A3D8RA65_9EURO|nr:Uncharacterized protein DSM5745_08361 [Aspergillus mulundensis]RDW70850.1 Uncharacterized protein DSM5745_08361 [Aspergillus mulundensis]